MDDKNITNEEIFKIAFRHFRLLIAFDKREKFALIALLE